MKNSLRVFILSYSLICSHLSFAAGEFAATSAAALATVAAGGNAPLEEETNYNDDAIKNYADLMGIDDEGFEDPEYDEEGNPLSPTYSEYIFTNQLAQMANQCRDENGSWINGTQNIIEEDGKLITTDEPVGDKCPEGIDNCFTIPCDQLMLMEYNLLAGEDNDPEKQQQAFQCITKGWDDNRISEKVSLMESLGVTLTKEFVEDESLNCPMQTMDEQARNQDKINMTCNLATAMPMVGTIGTHLAKFAGGFLDTKYKICPKGNGGCMKEIFMGLINNVVANAKGMWDIAKMVGGGIWGGVKGLFGGGKEADEKLADTQHFIENKDDSYADLLFSAPPKIGKLFAKFQDDMMKIGKSIWDSTLGGIKDFACEEWSAPRNLPFDGQEPVCLKPLVNFTCSSWEQRSKMLCGAAGFIGGEIATAFLTGGTINAVGKLGKGGAALIKATKLAKKVSKTKSGAWLAQRIGSKAMKVGGTNFYKLKGKYLIKTGDGTFKAAPSDDVLRAALSGDLGRFSKAYNNTKVGIKNVGSKVVGGYKSSITGIKGTGSKISGKAKEVIVEGSPAWIKKTGRGTKAAGTWTGKKALDGTVWTAKKIPSVVGNALTLGLAKPVAKIYKYSGLRSLVDLTDDAFMLGLNLGNKTGAKNAVLAARAAREVNRMDKQMEVLRKQKLLTPELQRTGDLLKESSQNLTKLMDDLKKMKPFDKDVASQQVRAAMAEHNSLVSAFDAYLETAKIAKHTRVPGVGLARDLTYKITRNGGNLGKGTAKGLLSLDRKIVSGIKNRGQKALRRSKDELAKLDSGLSPNVGKALDSEIGASEMLAKAQDELNWATNHRGKHRQSINVSRALDDLPPKTKIEIKTGDEFIEITDPKIYRDKLEFTRTDATGKRVTSEISINDSLVIKTTRSDGIQSLRASTGSIDDLGAYNKVMGNGPMRTVTSSVSNTFKRISKRKFKLDVAEKVGTRFEKLTDLERARVLTAIDDKIKLGKPLSKADAFIIANPGLADLSKEALEAITGLSKNFKTKRDALAYLDDIKGKIPKEQFDRLHMSVSSRIDDLPTKTKVAKKSRAERVAEQYNAKLGLEAEKAASVAAASAITDKALDSRKAADSTISSSAKMSATNTPSAKKISNARTSRKTSLELDRVDLPKLTSPGALDDFLGKNVKLDVSDFKSTTAADKAIPKFNKLSPEKQDQIIADLMKKLDEGKIGSELDLQLLYNYAARKRGAKALSPQQLRFQIANRNKFDANQFIRRDQLSYIRRNRDPFTEKINKLVHQNHEDIVRKVGTTNERVAKSYGVRASTGKVKSVAKAAGPSPVPVVRKVTMEVVDDPRMISGRLQGDVKALKPERFSVNNPKTRLQNFYEQAGISPATDFNNLENVYEAMEKFKALPAATRTDIMRDLRRALGNKNSKVASELDMHMLYTHLALERGLADKMLSPLALNKKIANSSQNKIEMLLKRELGVAGGRRTLPSNLQNDFTRLRTQAHTIRGNQSPSFPRDMDVNSPLITRTTEVDQTLDDTLKAIRSSTAEPADIALLRSSDANPAARAGYQRALNNYPSGTPGHDFVKSLGRANETDRYRITVQKGAFSPDELIEIGHININSQGVISGHKLDAAGNKVGDAIAIDPSTVKSMAHIRENGSIRGVFANTNGELYELYDEIGLSSRVGSGALSNSQIDSAINTFYKRRGILGTSAQKTTDFQQKVISEILKKNPTQINHADVHILYNYLAKQNNVRPLSVSDLQKILKNDSLSEAMEKINRSLNINGGTDEMIALLDDKVRALGLPETRPGRVAGNPPPAGTSNRVPDEVIPGSGAGSGPRAPDTPSRGSTNRADDVGGSPSTVVDNSSSSSSASKPVDDTPSTNSQASSTSATADNASSSTPSTTSSPGSTGNIERFTETPSSNKFGDTFVKTEQPSFVSKNTSNPTMAKVDNDIPFVTPKPATKQAVVSPTSSAVETKYFNKDLEADFKIANAEGQMVSIKTPSGETKLMNPKIEGGKITGNRFQAGKSATSGQRIEIPMSEYRGGNIRQKDGVFRNLSSSVMDPAVHKKIFAAPSNAKELTKIKELETQLAKLKKGTPKSTAVQNELMELKAKVVARNFRNSPVDDQAMMVTYLEGKIARGEELTDAEFLMLAQHKLYKSNKPSQNLDALNAELIVKLNRVDRKDPKEVESVINEFLGKARGKNPSASHKLKARHLKDLAERTKRSSLIDELNDVSDDVIGAAPATVGASTSGSKVVPEKGSAVAKSSKGEQLELDLNDPRKAAAAKTESGEQLTLKGIDDTKTPPTPAAKTSKATDSSPAKGASTEAPISLTQKAPVTPKAPGIFSRLRDRVVQGIISIPFIGRIFFADDGKDEDVYGLSVSPERMDDGSVICRAKIMKNYKVWEDPKYDHFSWTTDKDGGRGLASIDTSQDPKNCGEDYMTCMVSNSDYDKIYANVEIKGKIYRKSCSMKDPVKERSVASEKEPDESIKIKCSLEDGQFVTKVTMGGENMSDEDVGDDYLWKVNGSESYSLCEGSSECMILAEDLEEGGDLYEMKSFKATINIDEVEYVSNNCPMGDIYDAIAESARKERKEEAAKLLLQQQPAQQQQFQPAQGAPGSDVGIIGGGIE